MNETDRRPLFGKRVLVTRARGRSSETVALLEERGAEALVVPTIEIHAPSDPAPLARAVTELRAGSYGWVAFTSANAVERTWAAVEAAGGNAQWFSGARIAAIGPATARALGEVGLRADVTAKEFVGEALAAELLAADAAAEAKPRVLLPRAAVARDALPDALRAAGYPVDVVTAYETRPPSPDTIAGLVTELERGRVDAVLFTSGSTVDNLCDLLGNRAPRLLSKVRVACIGPMTLDTARRRGLRVDVTAREYTLPALIEALAESWG
jgi:uroporphyrinogen III methyltransferase/synthase